MHKAINMTVLVRTEVKRRVRPKITKCDWDWTWYVVNPASRLSKRGTLLLRHR